MYCKSNSNTLQKVNSEIKSVRRDMCKLKEIDKKIMNYLTVKKAQLGRFYLLPKIHKWTMNVPGRPVISNNGTATERISSFLDFHLKNIIPTIPHVLEDTQDFLYRIEQLQNISEGTLLVSFDVVGLYPHKLHDEGLKIMKKYLDKCEDQSVTSGNLYTLVEVVLKHNYFEFGQDVYQQILSTTIGTKFAPPYGNIFMAGLEEKVFKNPQFKPFLWLRYLDDIFCLWTEVVDKLKEFFNYLNELHPSIKFTIGYSEKKINFLDVLVTKSDSGEKLCSILYTKPTDTYQYLHDTSCHRAVYKNSIAYGQAIRLKRICSDENDLQRNLVSLESWLVNKSYRAEKARPAIQKINLIDRANLLIKKSKHQENYLLFTQH